jgi:hypothetical protein
MRPLVLVLYVQHINFGLAAPGSAFKRANKKGSLLKG